MQKITWTGGSTPRPFSKTGLAERELVHKFFREQIADCGREWFFSTPFGVMNYARILWNRARHDAHATRRSQGAA